MKPSTCLAGDKPCPHLVDQGGQDYCTAFGKPVETVNKCGPKLVKAALKKQKLDEKLKGKKQ